jgi:hypothetical protein
VIFRKYLVIFHLDPDPDTSPELDKDLNPEVHSPKRLDPYQQKVNADPKHCLL